MFQFHNQSQFHYFDMAPVPMLILNGHGDIVYQNAECDSLFCIPSANLCIDNYLTQHVWHEIKKYFSKMSGCVPRKPFIHRVLMKSSENAYTMKVNVATTSPSRSYIVVITPCIEENKSALLQVKSFLEQLPICMAMIDGDGSFISANRAFCDLLGYDVHTLRTKSESGITFKSDTDREQRLQTRMVLKKDHQYSVNKRYIHSTGQHIWVRTFVSRISGYAREKAQYMIAAVDIHEEKQLQDVIATSERRFRAIAENVSSVVWMSGVDPMGLLYVNKCYNMVWEEPVEKLYTDGRTFLDKVHPVDRELAASTRFNSSNESWNINYRLQFDDGRIKHIRDSGHCVFDGCGDLIYRIGTSTDITAEISQRDNMVVMAEKLRELVDYDTLTGLKSRHAIMSDIHCSFQHFERTNNPSVLLYIDADGFKNINDTFGHDIGDKVLHAIGNHLTRNIRETDVAGRIGGDEFIVLLRHTAQVEVSKILERLCSEIIDSDLPSDINVSFSLGATELSSGILSVEQWVNDADKIMYHNKRDRKRQRRSQVRHR